MTHIRWKDKLVCGVGLNDVAGLTKSALGFRQRNLWSHIIHRCYDSKVHDKQPTYVGCLVCEEWLVLSNFIRDLPKIENYDLWLNGNPRQYFLDKDSILCGNRLYALGLVKFITKEESALEVLSRNPTVHKNLSERNIKYKSKKVFLSVDNGETFLEFNSGKECAEYLEVDPTTVGKWLKGVNKLPNNVIVKRE